MAVKSGVGERGGGPDGPQWSCIELSRVALLAGSPGLGPVECVCSSGLEVGAVHPAQSCLGALAWVPGLGSQPC